jgi:hypothetical protein
MRSTSFYSESLSLMGGQESAFVGLDDGSLVKLNFSRVSPVLPGATDFGTPGVSKLPMWWEAVPPENTRKKQETEETSVPKKYTTTG